MRQLFTFNYHILRTLHTKIGRVKYSDFEHPTLQGATAPTRDTQGVASLALGYVLHWAFSPYLHIHFYYTQALMVQPPRCCLQPVLAHTLLLYRN